jgi:hypothetical protein
MPTGLARPLARARWPASAGPPSGAPTDDDEFVILRASSVER